jgi:DNA polymerase-4
VRAELGLPISVGVARSKHLAKIASQRQPGTKRGMARWMADRAVDMIRDRFGWEAIKYGSVALELSRSVPDEFRELAEKNL